MTIMIGNKNDLGVLDVLSKRAADVSSDHSRFKMLEDFKARMSTAGTQSDPAVRSGVHSRSVSSEVDGLERIDLMTWFLSSLPVWYTHSFPGKKGGIS